MEGGAGGERVFEGVVEVVMEDFSFLAAAAAAGHLGMLMAGVEDDLLVTTGTGFDESSGGEEVILTTGTAAAAAAGGDGFGVEVLISSVFFGRLPDLPLPLITRRTSLFTSFRLFR